ncbi:MAG TPA: hypothetical protein VGR51_01535 [Thermoplasmata archaeon]|nr:hypothetical protein [Thermoplasmata archaeon]
MKVGSVGLLACVLGLMIVPAVFATPARAGTAYAFNLVTPNTAMSPDGYPFAGDTIRIRGGGSFDVEAGSVDASGAFTHILADGTVFAHGTWVATGLVGFTAFGGPNGGLQGGVLTISVNVIHQGVTVFEGLTMTVTCVINAPEGFEEGTTLGPFVLPTGGETLIHAAD